jgi:hypothetical protein
MGIPWHVSYVCVSITLLGAGVGVIRCCVEVELGFGLVDAAAAEETKEG